MNEREGDRKREIERRGCVLFMDPAAAEASEVGGVTVRVAGRWDGNENRMDENRMGWEMGCEGAG